MIEYLVPVLATTLAAATPLVFAGLGELVTEKSGVINLGVEGMMLIGAVAGFAGGLHWGVAGGLLCGALAGALAALPFAFLTLSLGTNQPATGLALTIFGIGLSAFVGQYFVSQSLPGLQPLIIPGLAEIPLLGPVFFSQSWVVYLSWLAFAWLAWMLARTRWGLILRAVGESPEAAHAIGYPVTAIRYAATCFGGAMAGIGGAYLSTVYTPLWVQNMTAGRGWIAVALVVFATWKPGRLMLGAYLFGGMTILQLHAQGLGVELPSQLLAAVPYVATIVVLVLISRDRKLLQLNLPASLGKPWISN
ncbi:MULTISPECIES: ABC transporter permease [unclassified Uliginosibacterium]|uniref:ABC transporter permease n=1 Tax=unclassified Uliginosibacterium TaxID=2621521 RepID=UPI000C7C9872|nr:MULTISPECIES: ABC transporter permease [unclassified Uliginosibacterium]MDO6385969.1 ABC transporter permease [Uliginosibacterium sp. 31-12]PLK49979.1 ABC transporter permease [Uliginosibacterium sp. TH139]